LARTGTRVLLSFSHADLAMLILIKINVSIEGSGPLSSQSENASTGRGPNLPAPIK
jgi:hypothetical protein